MPSIWSVYLHRSMKSTLRENWQGRALLKVNESFHLPISVTALLCICPILSVI